MDTTLAQRLVAEQFPALAALPVRLLGAGWDNTVFVVGDEWVFRFPAQRGRAAGLPRLEIELLPELAPLLPFPIPVPEHIGVPSEAFRGRSSGRVSCRESSSATRRRPPSRRSPSSWRAFSGRCTAREVMDALGERLAGELDEAGGYGAARADDRRQARRARRDLAGAAPRARRSRRGAVAAAARAACDLPRRPALPPRPRRRRSRQRHHRLDRPLPRRSCARPSARVERACLRSSRPAFFAEYGDVDDATLLRARVVAVFLGTALLEFSRHEGLASVEREARASLARVATP